MGSEAQRGAGRPMRFWLLGGLRVEAQVVEGRGAAGRLPVTLFTGYQLHLPVIRR